MLDRLTEIFCEIDDFCKGFFAQWSAYLVADGKSGRPRGPDCGLAESEIMTILLLYHGSNYRHLKNFYNGVVLGLLKNAFPKAPCYDRFIVLQSKIAAPLTAFLSCRRGKKTGIYYIDSTALPVCHNRRIYRHKVFKGIAARGKTSTGWFFGLKLHLVFNSLNEIVAAKLTAGNVHDAAPVAELTKELLGKLFGDKGYIGKKLADELFQRGLELITRPRKNMKAKPIAYENLALLNRRNMAETIIGNIKEFSSLNIPKHRSVINACIHILAAVAAYILNPISPKFLIQNS